MYIHRSCSALKGVAPYAVEDSVAAQYRSSVFEQQGEQLEFLIGQHDLCASCRYRAVGEGEDYIACLETVGRCGLR